MAVTKGKSRTANKVGAKKTTSKRRHKFQSFPEQLRQLRVPRFGTGVQFGGADDLGTGAAADPSSDVFQSSHFEHVLQKWRDLNLSDKFSRLSRESYPLCSSLGQLLHNRNKVAAMLKASASMDDSDSDLTLHMEPILDLWRALAEDLQGMFWPFFEDFCVVVIGATRLQSTAIVKMCYSSLSGILKVLQRLAPDKSGYLLETVIDVTLSEDNRAKLPSEALKFVAFALSQVVRRASNEGMFTSLFKHVTNSKAEKVPFFCHIILSSCLIPMPKVCDMDEALRIGLNLLPTESFWQTFLDLSKDSYQQDSHLVLNAVVALALKEWKKDPNFFLTMITACVERGYQVEDAIFKWAGSLASTMPEHEPFLDTLLSTLRAVLVASDQSIHGDEALSIISDAVSHTDRFLGKISSFIVSLPDIHWTFDPACKLLFARFEKAEMSNENIKTMSQSILAVSDETQWELQRIIMPLSVSEEMSLKLTDDAFECEDFCSLLTCLVYVNPVSRFWSSAESVTPVLEKVLAMTSLGWSAELGKIIVAFLRLAKKTDAAVDYLRFLEAVLPLVEKHLLTLEASEAMATICLSDPARNALLVQVTESGNLSENLVRAIDSPSRPVRVNNLKSLCALHQNVILEKVLRIESEQLDITSYRDRLRLLNSAVSNIDNEPNLIKRTLLHVVIANLYEDFSLVWKPTLELLINCETRLGKELFWEALLGTFRRLIQATIGEDEITRSLQNARNQLIKAIGMTSTLTTKEGSVVVNAVLDLWKSSKSKSRPKGMNESTAQLAD